MQEAKTELRSVRLQLQEQQALTAQLESERDGFAAELAELRDALQEAEKRLGIANATLNQLKTDTERRIRDKDDELDAMRYCPPVDIVITRMWANAQRDGRPAEYRWRPLFNAAKFG